MRRKKFVPPFNRRQVKKDQLRKMERLLKEKRVIHFVTITVDMKSHDNNHPMLAGAPPGSMGPGPALSSKTASFWGMGSRLDDAVRDAMNKANEWMLSDSIHIGTLDGRDEAERQARIRSGDAREAQRDIRPAAIGRRIPDRDPHDRE